MRKIDDFIKERKKHDFVQIPNQILIDPNLTNTEKILWENLCRFKWTSESTISPSRKTVAEAMGWEGKQVVTNYYKKLEEKGYLKYIEKGQGNNTSKIELFYEPNIDTNSKSESTNQKDEGVNQLGVEQEELEGSHPDEVRGINSEELQKYISRKDETTKHTTTTTTTTGDTKVSPTNVENENHSQNNPDLDGGKNPFLDSPVEDSPPLEENKNSPPLEPDENKGPQVYKLMEYHQPRYWDKYKEHFSRKELFQLFNILGQDVPLRCFKLLAKEELIELSTGEYIYDENNDLVEETELKKLFLPYPMQEKEGNLWAYILKAWETYKGDFMEFVQLELKREEEADITRLKEAWCSD